ncbi:hypothetical protein [Chenggangzhangella methanolivorans]|uniref:Uncharacterized protein n=1 Tax=Chenggangzhangella methanolivorans TaxID=1437009 RepID=A0A9E6R626_9HYPH|nr:hypothetical protein [Chenggangzhangella methanolivorans]QZN98558.1 hypothetical protein K6K41_16100 [Chenggangzhangella methanolivorans]
MSAPIKGYTGDVVTFSDMVDELSALAAVVDLVGAPTHSEVKEGRAFVAATVSDLLRQLSERLHGLNGGAS